MKMRLRSLTIITKKTTELLVFSDTCTFLYGPVGTGKSTVARLVDYCLGGSLEETPAIQQEFVAAELSLILGEYNCTLERSLADTQSVRATWSRNEKDIGSINAPLKAGEESILGDKVFNLSDLIFFLSGTTPIKVRKSQREADSPMIRLSFRDIWWYCYLEQNELDSSLFHLSDPFRGRKSQDAMRFFTGLHSERLSELESELYRGIDHQNGKREAVRQIRSFMAQFELESELDVQAQLNAALNALTDAESRRRILEHDRNVKVHPTDSLREQLRNLGAQIGDLNLAIRETENAISEQTALRAELITSKVKTNRTEQAGRIFEDITYARCPQCGTDVSARPEKINGCRLCGCEKIEHSFLSSIDLEVMRRELNDRIDQIVDSISRRTRELERSKRKVEQLKTEKRSLDDTLQRELARYDSAFGESVRDLDREIATLTERIKSLTKLQKMPRAINDLEDEAAALQAHIDRIRNAIEQERLRLKQADVNISVLSNNFKKIILSVGFPGVEEKDEIDINPRNWNPVIIHGQQEWSFDDAGSGGKKTLFNVCYALAIHETAREQGMPVPTVLIIDSPTKNISNDENPALVTSLYREIYRLASVPNNSTQFLVIDSDLVEPRDDFQNFLKRHMAGTTDDPCLIPYYTGP